MTPWKVYGCSQNYKKFVSKVFDFIKILKIQVKILSNPRTFLSLFYVVQRKDAHMKDNIIKVEEVDGRALILDIFYKRYLF